jgi:membrane associated rhomboid family serine protease
MNRISSVVLILVATNVILFFASTREGLNLQDMLALYFPENPQYAPWQYVTSMFMHGGLAHLLFNMLGLWMFGTALEHFWGKYRFLVFYFLTGIGAGLIYTFVNDFQFNQLLAELTAAGFSSADVQLLLEEGKYRTDIAIPEALLGELYQLYNTPVVGASGAVYGILVAYALMFPNAKLVFLFIPYPIAAKYFVPALIALDLFSGVTGFSIFGGGIAHFAHVGGAIIGFLLMMYWRFTLSSKSYEKR